MVDSRLLDIEEHALAAWPAAEVEPLDGWWLRAMNGVSRRANSVWTARTISGRSLERRVEVAEVFYHQRGLCPTFQVSGETCPLIDAELALRGYRIEAPVAVRVAPAYAVAYARDAAAPCRAQREALAIVIDVRDRLSDDWFELSAERGRFALAQGAYRALLERIGGRALFALARVDGRPAAVGLGVVGLRWMGVASMFTAPEYRRRGAAQAILRALAERALSRAVPSMYLQVERDNETALRLYEALGFVEHHGYHYRVAPRRA